MKETTQVNAVSTVVSILLTGALVFQTLGIPPLLDVTFFFVLEERRPIWFSIALGAIGSYAVFYQILFVLFLSPMQCYTGLGFSYNRVDLRTLKFSDFINIVIVYLFYLLLLHIQNIPITNSAILGGVLTIFASLSISIIPRVVSKSVHGCWWTVKAVAVSIPATILVYIPILLLISVT